VGRPDGTSLFWVDVKGFGSNIDWFIKRRPTLENLFYILVRVGETRGGDIFFVLIRQQVNDLIDGQRWIDESRGIRLLEGSAWKAPEPYKENWKILPGWPSLAFADLDTGRIA
jgi:hypothetical protein